MSRECALPILYVIYNNNGWQRSRQATFGHAPNGWATAVESVPLCEWEASPDYEKICEANGGYGELVDDAAELPGALKRALDVVRREKRQALLNVIAKRG